MAQWCLQEEELVTDHPSAEDFALLASGQLSRRKQAELLRHLVQGCPACSGLLALHGIPTPAEVPEEGYDEVVARAVARASATAQAGTGAVAILASLLSGERSWNAHRICDALSRASRAMNRAVHWSRRGSQSDLLLARIADLLASLLGAQRRFPEACQLLYLVYHAHEKNGRPHLAGRALFSAGNMAALDG